MACMSFQSLEPPKAVSVLPSRIMIPVVQGTVAAPLSSVVVLALSWEPPHVLVVWDAPMASHSCLPARPRPSKMDDSPPLDRRW